jgi:hypothetical protein
MAGNNNNNNRNFAPNNSNLREMKRTPLDVEKALSSGETFGYRNVGSSDPGGSKDIQTSCTDLNKSLSSADIEKMKTELFANRQTANSVTQTINDQMTQTISNQMTQTSGTFDLSAPGSNNSGKSESGIPRREVCMCVCVWVLCACMYSFFFRCCCVCVRCVFFFVKWCVCVCVVCMHVFLFVKWCVSVSVCFVFVHVFFFVNCKRAPETGLPATYEHTNIHTYIHTHTHTHTGTIRLRKG